MENRGKARCGMGRNKSKNASPSSLPLSPPHAPSPPATNGVGIFAVHETGLADASHLSGGLENER